MDDRDSHNMENLDSIPERVQGQQGQLKRERLLHEFIEAEFDIDTSNSE